MNPKKKSSGGLSYKQSTFLKDYISRIKSQELLNSKDNSQHRWSFTKSLTITEDDDYYGGIGANVGVDVVDDDSEDDEDDSDDSEDIEDIDHLELSNRNQEFGEEEETSDKTWLFKDLKPSKQWSSETKQSTGIGYEPIHTQKPNPKYKPIHFSVVDPPQYEPQTCNYYDFQALMCSIRSYFLPSKGNLSKLDLNGIQNYFQQIIVYIQKYYDLDKLQLMELRGEFHKIGKLQQQVMASHDLGHWRQREGLERVNMPRLHGVDVVEERSLARITRTMKNIIGKRQPVEKQNMK